MGSSSGEAEFWCLGMSRMQMALDRRSVLTAESLAGL